MIAVDVDRVEYAGAGDPVAALLFCGPVKVDLSVIDGRVIVEGGRLLGIDLDAVMLKHTEIAGQMRE